jgi:PAS domain S-box-containing protein
MIEQESRRVARMLEQLLALSPDGALAFDREFRFLFWSPAMERISGLKAHEVLGKNALELFPFFVESGEDDNFRQALAGRSTQTSERPYAVVSTGRRGLYEAHYAPLRSETGEVVGGLALVRDVTEQRRAEERLRETETRFQNMADASPVMLWMSGTDGLCNFFNQTWLRFTGRTLAEEWGVGWAELVHFEDLQRCMDTYTAAFNERRPFEVEYRLQRADGEYRWILDRGVPRYTPDGTFAGYIGSCLDITEHKQVEATLCAAVRLREEFLSIASHELRTPLTALQLQLESLNRTLQNRPEEGLRSGRLGRNARVASEQTARLTSLIDVLLDVSRMMEGRLALEIEELELGSVVSAVVEGFRAPAAEARCELHLQADTALFGRWDRLRLEQVISNLLSNAIKYAPGRPVSITVEGDLERVRLIVADQGPGIPPEAHARIFERFERAAPMSHAGFGLGLWISRQSIEAMGGSIWVESASGSGATFIVELPRRPPEAVVEGSPPCAVL